MTIDGTAAYQAYAANNELPPLVRAAVESARESGFGNCCLPEHGELLRVLARGVGPGVIGETGTGSGVGLAWLASAAHPGARLVSVELDEGRATRAAELFHEVPRAEVVHGDWRKLKEYGPFDLLALDGGGQGKGSDPAIEPAEWLRPGGLVVMDDFAPLTSYPPMFQGRIDAVRRYWFEHPRLRATQIRVTPEWSALLAVYVG
jgi:predicted O-methyltransferase YrrM